MESERVNEEKEKLKKIFSLRFVRERERLREREKYLNLRYISLLLLIAARKV